MLTRALGPALASKLPLYSTEKAEATYYSNSAVLRQTSLSKIAFQKDLVSLLAQTSFLFGEDWKGNKLEDMLFSAISSFSTQVKKYLSRKESFSNIFLATACHEEAVLLLGELAFEPNKHEILQQQTTRQSRLNDVCFLGVDIPAIKDVQNISEHKDLTTTELCLNGYGARTLRMPLGWDINVYVATLYTKSPICSEQDFVAYLGQQKGNHFVMDFTFLQAVNPIQMSIAWNYQLDTSVTHHYEGYSDDRDEFLRMLEGSMVKNGTITFEYVDGIGLKVINQGQMVGVIPRKDFALAFASMFLGENPVTSALKDGLLQDPLRGLKDENSKTKEQTRRQMRT